MSMTSFYHSDLWLKNAFTLFHWNTYKYFKGCTFLLLLNIIKKYRNFLNFYIVGEKRIHHFPPVLSRFEFLVLLINNQIIISCDETEHFLAKIASHLHGTFLHFINRFKLRIYYYPRDLFLIFFWNLFFPHSLRWRSEILSLSEVISPSKHSLMYCETDLTSHKPKADTCISCFLWKHFICCLCQRRCHLINTHNGRFMDHYSRKKSVCSNRNAISQSFGNILEEKTCGNISEAMLNVFKILQLFYLTFKIQESLGIWSKSFVLDAVLTSTCSFCLLVKVPFCLLASV